MTAGRQPRKPQGRDRRLAASGNSKRFLYLLGGGGALVAAAIAIVVFAAIGNSNTDSGLPADVVHEGSDSSPTHDELSQNESIAKLPPVTLEEFGDFQCSHCMQFALGIGKQLKEDFVNTGKIRFVFRHFPFIGEESFRAAEATECAADQNKFWEYHDTVFENWGGVNEGHFSDENLKEFAGRLQLDRTAFDSCLDSGKYRGKVESDIRLGEQLGVNSTPTLFLDGRRIEPVSYDDLTRIIESAIASAQ